MSMSFDVIVDFDDCDVFSQCAWGPTPTRCSLAHSRSVAAAGAADTTMVINQYHYSTAN
jgi:hypothetical protein